MKRNFKLIGINIVITLLLVFLLNTLSNGILLGYKVIGSHIESRQEDQQKVALPNYQNNPNFAKVHFREFNRLMLQYEPFVEWSRTPFQGKTITIDAQGDRFHSNISPLNSQGRSSSVHFFGGSTMWGTGAADKETIPATFNLKTGVPTFNRGETGFNARQSLARFIQILTVSKEPIKQAIFYDGVNEILSLCPSEHKVGEHIRAYRMREGLKDQANVIPTSEFQRYLDYLFFRGTRSLVFELAQLLSNRKRWNCDTQPEKAQQIAESLLKTWEVAHSIAEKAGIKFLAILQPVAFIGEPNLDHLSHLQARDNLLGKQYRTVYPIIQKLIQERQYKWIVDYTDLFSTNEYIYVDFCHVSAPGNERVARRISQDLGLIWQSN